MNRFRHSFWAKLLLLLFSICGTLLVLEIALKAVGRPRTTSTWRIRRVFQMDRDLVYSMRPNYFSSGVESEHGIPLSTNRYGLRGDDPREPGEYEKRIIIIGDSMTFGHGVWEKACYPRKLEQVFSRHDRRVEVINAGVQGYGTDQACKLFLERLRPLNPDLLIFAVYINDLSDNISRPLYSIEGDALEGLDATKNWLYLLGRFDRMVPSIIGKRASTTWRFRDWGIATISPSSPISTRTG